MDILENIKNNTELLEVFNVQTYIWWNNTNIIDLLSKIIKKYIIKNSNVYNIAIQFKMSLKSLIDKPAELLEYINSCLKPKDIEKKIWRSIYTYEISK